MLEYLLKTSTNVFCQYCPRWEGLRRGSVMRSRCQASWPSPTTTLDRKRTSKRRHHVWSVERFALCFRSVHGWMGMHVWVNVFTMPFFCTDSGPWRKMSLAWPAMSAITALSGTICWSICWTLSQMFSVSTFLGDKASKVKQPWGASAKLPESRLGPDLQCPP